MISAQMWLQLLNIELSKRDATLSTRRLGVVLTLRSSVRLVGFVSDAFPENLYIKLTQSDGVTYVDPTEVAAIEVKK